MGYRQFEKMDAKYETPVKLETLVPQRTYKIGSATYTFFETAEWKSGSWLSSLDNKNYLMRLKEISEKYGEPKISSKMHMTGCQKTCNDYK